MKYLGALLGVLVLAVAARAEFGYYIPKAFYKIDENGYRSPLTYIDNLPPMFHRTRRAAQLGGVNFGFPIQFPQFPQIPTNGQSTFQGVQTSITSTGGGSNLHNRFDEDGPAVQTTFTSFSSNNGQISQTTHIVDKDGKVTTHKQESGPSNQQSTQQQQQNQQSVPSQKNRN
ncbi:uncharacterized protein LOC131435746 [Malaya genurostris]|uniref:uncharacterized protein LOC131435746 n=1 Tax=Malaya genurostris TaxID=325434 RepID=UPI0026F3F204|nr:uncharacterized protein LOC131435746 [Malaya genurostris]